MERGLDLKDRWMGCCREEKEEEEGVVGRTVFVVVAVCFLETTCR